MRLYVMESSGEARLLIQVFGEDSLRLAATHGYPREWVEVAPGAFFQVQLSGLDAIASVPALREWEEAAAAHERFADRQGDTVSGLQHRYAAEVIRGVMDRIRAKAGDA